MTRGNVFKLTSEMAVERALLAASKNNVRYHLGAGGKDPLSDSPGTPSATAPNHLESDCVGFTCWASGIDRYQPQYFKRWGGWINTDSAIEEAEDDSSKSVLKFKKLNGSYDTALPGDWILFNSIDADHDGRRDRVGHVGIIVAKSSNGSDYVSSILKGTAQGLLVAQCSPANEVHGDDSIAVTSAATWAFGSGRVVFRGKVYESKGTRIIRPLWYTDHKKDNGGEDLPF